MMTDRCAIHATFSIERVYSAPAGRVFAAWADPGAKARWFAGPDSEHQLDFRVGGREIARGRGHDGAVLTFESLYRDIVPGERIVYTSVLSSGDRVATVSVTTVELSAEGEGTRLVLTEQGTFLDGLEQPSWREQGISGQLEALGEELKDR
ncbi:MAG: SRPBCC family protein [Micromonosporaceae bacterium]